MFKKTKNHKISDPNNYVWVKSIGQIWKIKIQNVTAYCFMISIVSTPILFVAILFTPWAFILLISFWGITLPMLFIAAYVITTIKCTQCGYKPSISKKTGKHINDNQLRDRALKLDECPSCNPRYKKEKL